MALQQVKVRGDILTFRVPRELSQQLTQMSARDCETRSVVIRRLLRLGLRAEDVTIAGKTRRDAEEVMA